VYLTRGQGRTSPEWDHVWMGNQLLIPSLKVDTKYEVAVWDVNAGAVRCRSRVTATVCEVSTMIHNQPLFGTDEST